MRRPYLLAAFLLLLSSLSWAQDLFDPNLTPEGVRAALAAGADVEARDNRGSTPLLFAALANSNPEVVQVLLDAGADLEARTEWGATPLMFAARHNENPEIVQALLNAGADLEARDESRGWTPLMHAAGFNENPEVVLALLNAGADPAATDGDGKTVWGLIQENDALEDAYGAVRSKLPDEPYDAD